MTTWNGEFLNSLQTLGSFFLHIQFEKLKFVLKPFKQNSSDSETMVSFRAVKRYVTFIRSPSLNVRLFGS